jgi:hypothetical protein
LKMFRKVCSFLLTVFLAVCLRLFIASKFEFDPVLDDLYMYCLLPWSEF